MMRLVSNHWRDAARKVVAHVCVALTFAVAPSAAAADNATPADFGRLAGEYDGFVHPLLATYCLDCHSAETKEGELDLERFSALEAVRRDPATWQKVRRMLRDAEMPPEDSPQPSAEEIVRLQSWVQQYLDAEALSNAGDPGPVVLRRLNNAQYTYTIRDLTGAALDPVREFPVDGAAGEGFTNTGSGLAMSPALAQKYLDAAKDVASHAVLLPTGFRFSEGETRRDWADEVLTQIRRIYARHTSGNRDVGALDRWTIRDPKESTANDGRIDLTAYFAALLAHREAIDRDLATVGDIAEDTGLNAKYLRLLAEMLTADEPASALLESVRRRFRAVTTDDAEALVAEIGAWQEKLWTFNAVGHLGIIRPWQAPVSPLVERVPIRVPIPESADDAATVLYLTATAAGDGGEGDQVLWQRPRIERDGGIAIPLADASKAAAALRRARGTMQRAAGPYLAAAKSVRDGTAPTVGDLDSVDVHALAEAHGLPTPVLVAWLDYLGFASPADATIREYLHEPLRGVGGYDAVRGWTQPNSGALSLVSNASDDEVAIPGTMPPHGVAAHPLPDRFVGVAWKSPTAGSVRITPRVGDSHGACGNGVTWSCELRRGPMRRTLAAGEVDNGAAPALDPLAAVAVRQGDLISLVIGPRDGNHSCDLTAIDLTIEKTGDDGLRWSLAADCADSIDAGNPHADGFGNADVWHFYTGDVDGNEEESVLPPGSLIARWSQAGGNDTADQLASEIETLFRDGPDDETSEADADWYRQANAWDGPLWTRVDATALAMKETDETSTPNIEVVSGEFARDGDDLLVEAPEVLEIRVPGDVFRGSFLAVTGTVTNDMGSVQLQVSSSPPPREETLLPGVPPVARAGTVAGQRMENAFADFRALFPTAMCHARIVPVDEVVTLLLYHREDEALCRLMLSDAECAELDRLWDELNFVSQAPLRILTSLEQLIEFSTQDADPSRFDPVKKPIEDQAAAFRQWLLDTESVQVDALIAWAERAYRRPLSGEAAADLRDLYQTLRQQDLAHEDAFRMTLARVLTSPAFLYRLETPGPASEPAPVDDWELANRLSFFLWSSLPDGELAEAAASGTLAQPDVLRTQARRMLRDARVRRLAIEFGCQWLHVRDFDETGDKSERHFPEFAELRGAMYEETIRFFTDLFQNDGSVLDLIDSDHTFLNGALAAHYEIDGVDGDEWRRVDDVRRKGRGGILTQATVLSSQSGASRTSPILRGNWISETLLGERLPRPPPDVPQLPETVPSGLSERALIEQHSSVAACAKCHARIDPYGFALESYDAIGRRRTMDLTGSEIDVTATLPDGTSIDGMDGLQTYLRDARRDDFLRQFSRKLLGFALGRSVQLWDEPLVEQMLERLAANDYHVGVVVEAIILSEPFRNIRGASADADGATGEDVGELP